LVDFLPLGSGSVDPHIFADPDPGSQNLADPTDPDPMHLNQSSNLKIFLFPFSLAFSHSTSSSAINLFTTTQGS